MSSAVKIGLMVGFAFFVMPLVLLITALAAFVSLWLWTSLHPMLGLAVPLGTGFFFTWSRGDQKLSLPGLLRRPLVGAAIGLLLVAAWSHEANARWVFQETVACDDCSEDYDFSVGLTLPVAIGGALLGVAVLSQSQRLTLAALATCAALVVYGTLAVLMFRADLETGPDLERFHSQSSTSSGHGTTVNLERPHHRCIAVFE